MKKHILILFLILLSIVSCTKNLDDYNLDTKSAQAGEAPAESLVSNAQISLARLLANPNVNFNIFRLLVQHWTETTYTDESNYDLVTRSIPDNFWAVIYRDVLRDLKEAKELVKKTDPKFTDPEIIKNRLAIIDVLEVYAYSVLLNTYGNIPYNEALDINNLTPKYDDAATIYADLEKRLDEDLANLNEGQNSFGKADVYYQGKVSSWKMFANSLKLKIGMTLADADPAKAKTMVEAAAPYVFKSQTDRAALKFFPAPPNTNPIWIELVQSKREDFVIANTLVDKMNALEDPRRLNYFTKVDDTYKGGIYGALNNYADFSKVNLKITEPEFESILMDYVETEFYLAEAIERGFQVSGTAIEHYNNATRSSIVYWGGTDAEADTYLAKPEVAYVTAVGDYKQKIGIQKWIALFNRGHEAWTEWRRLDAPTLVAPPTTTKAIPLRYTYPTSEQKLNSNQYEAAAATIGGDLTTTRLFWDKQ